MTTTPISSPKPATVTRRDALRDLPLAALGILATGIIPIGGTARATRRPGPTGGRGTATTPEILNLLLGVEYLQEEVYRAGRSMPALIVGPNRRVFEQISRQEGVHVASLRSLLGSDAAAKPTFDLTRGGLIPDALTSYTTFLAVAQALEDLAIRAYKGQLPALRSDSAVLAHVVGIHSVEARHAAVVRRIRGENSWITGIENETPLPPSLIAAYVGEDNHAQAGVDVGITDAASEAFDEPLTREQVLAITSPFVVR